MAFLKSYRLVFVLLLVFLISASSQRFVVNKAYGIGATVGSTETKTVSVSGSETTFSGIVNGATYEILISGWFYFDTDSGSKIFGDAQWKTPPGSTTYSIHNNSIAFNGTQKGSDDYKTQANTSTRTYKFTWTANTTSLKLKVVDSNYSDNGGGPLTAKVTLVSLTGGGGGGGTGNPKLSFDLLLHGIGKAGDNQNPGEAGGGTNPPDRLQRSIKVNVFNISGQQVGTEKEGIVEFDSTSGSFKTKPGSEIDLGTMAAGAYVIKVKMPQSITKSINKNIVAGTNTLSATQLITGDVNGDNAVNVEDYKIISGCVSDFEEAEDCSAENKAKSDLTDDGDVTFIDLNLLLRELSNGLGD